MTYVSNKLCRWHFYMSAPYRSYEIRRRVSGGYCTKNPPSTVQEAYLENEGQCSMMCKDGDAVGYK